MAAGEEEKKIRELFKTYMAEELKHPEIGRRKKAFIQEHFAPHIPFVLRPALLVPTLSFIFICVLALQLMKPVTKPIPQVALKETVKPKTLERTPFEEGDLGVQVKQVSSDMGSTLVFQKSSQGVPVIVIWVFTGGSNQ
ncbi:MAG: hypothetical protein HY584_04755 [Candidatus Omnitrophica bacterium]|nr:hypothetical protein [Candidatus Omnitrophota bacterium]